MDSETAFTDTRRFKVMRTVVGALNPLVVRLLGSRFAGPMARSLMLLRFTGRSSGRTFTTPVGYVRDGDRVVVVTSPTYRWWRNVEHGAEVAVRLDGAWHPARARVIPAADPAFDDAVALQVRGRGPGMLRGFGVPVDDHGHVPEAARSGLDQKALIVVIELRTSEPERGRP